MSYADAHVTSAMYSQSTGIVFTAYGTCENHEFIRCFSEITRCRPTPYFHDVVRE
jgi:hypothetical protein